MKKRINQKPFNAIFSIGFEYSYSYSCEFNVLSSCKSFIPCIKKTLCTMIDLDYSIQINLPYKFIVVFTKVTPKLI